MMLARIQAFFDGLPINYRAVVGILGALLFVVGAALLFPLLIAWFYGEPQWWGFLSTALVSMLLGGWCWYRYRPREELRVREGFAIVALSWFVLSLVGAVPYVLTGVLDSYTDAFFETMSGFTTTGATILGGGNTPEIEAVPNAFLFWRSLTHWLGGMGIIVLTLAVLPLLGVGGMQLFKAEVPGPSADKLTPLVKQTAQRLWLIYVGFSLLQFLLLVPAMGWFDAVNHAFATMATGGFSTENGSVGQYDSAYIDWVITLFMFLAGINFALHYRLLTGAFRTTFSNSELLAYTAIILGATLIITVSIYSPTPPPADMEQPVTYAHFLDALRHGAFQAVAIVTTTGFGTSDYENWPALGAVVIFLLFFVGGMAGSTGGGIKVVRLVVLAKGFVRELKRLVHPQALIPVRMGERVVTQEVLYNVLSFVVLFFFTISIGTLIMAMLGLDVMSALTASMSCVANIGPAYGTFGPTENYAHVPAIGKWVLALLMMTGRLELFTVYVLFTSSFWKR